MQDEVVSIRTATLEKRLRGRKPSCGELFPHEIVLLDYSNCYTNKTKRKEVSRFWRDSYGIKSVPDQLASLCERGFLKLGSLVDGMNLYTVPELKAVLKKYGLKVSGNKSQLIKRLCDEIEDLVLIKEFEKRPYQLTEKGLKHLSDNPWVMYYHRNLKSSGLVEVNDLAEYMSSLPAMEWHLKMIDFLKERQRNDIVFGSTYLRDQAKLYKEIGDSENEFNCFSKSTVYGFANVRAEDDFLECLCADLDFERCGFSSFEIEQFIQYRDLCGITNEELINLFIKNIIELDLPRMIMSPEDCGRMLMLFIQNKYDDVEKFKKTAFRAYKRNRKKMFNYIESLGGDEEDC